MLGVVTRSEVELQASRVLAPLGVGEPPVNAIAVANGLGIEVRAVRWSDDALRGRTIVRGGAPIIEVNADDPPNRRRFTIAHEVGHAVLHLLNKSHETISDTARELYRLSSIEPGTDPREIEANQFAAALLMPEDMVRRYHATEKDTYQLARVFNVSEDALAYRLKNLNLS